MLALRILDDVEGTIEREGARLVEMMHSRIARAVVTGAREAMDEFKRTGVFKDRTGKLRETAHIEGYWIQGDAVEATLAWPAEYASFVDAGTAPHVIRPKADHGFTGPLLAGQSRRAKNDYGVGRGHFLRWYDSPETASGVHFAREVHHPGTRPTGFAGAAALKAERVIVREIESATVELYAD